MDKLESRFSTTLKTAISGTGTGNIYLNAVPTESEGSLVIDIGTNDEEEIHYSSTGVDYVVCDVRGQGGTTATTHELAAVVKRTVVAKDVNDIVDLLEGTDTGAILNTPDIDGGTIDNTVIGGTTPVAGTFTTLNATTADINGGTINDITSLSVGIDSTDAPVILSTEGFSMSEGDILLQMEGETVWPRLRISGWNGKGGYFEGYSAGGTKASPSATPDEQDLTYLTAKGDEDGSTDAFGGWLTFKADGLWSSSNHGANLHIALTETGDDSTPSDAVIIKKNAYGGLLGIGREPDLALTMQSDGAACQQRIASYGGQANLIFSTTNGSVASPTNTVIGEDISKVITYGYDGTDFALSGYALWEASEAYSVGNHGSRHSIWVVPNGEESAEQIVTFDEDGIDLPTADDYYSREGTAITQKVAKGAGSETGDGADAIVTGLTDVHLFVLHSVIDADETYSVGSATGASDEDCVLIEPDANLVNYEADKIADHGAVEAVIASNSAGTVTLTWSGFSSQTVEYFWEAYGY